MYWRFSKDLVHSAKSFFHICISSSLFSLPVYSIALTTASSSLTAADCSFSSFTDDSFCHLQSTTLAFLSLLFLLFHPPGMYTPFNLPVASFSGLAGKARETFIFACRKSKAEREVLPGQTVTGKAAVLFLRQPPCIIRKRVPREAKGTIRSLRFA